MTTKHGNIFQFFFIFSQLFGQFLDLSTPSPHLQKPSFSMDPVRSPTIRHGILTKSISTPEKTYNLQVLLCNEMNILPIQGYGSMSALTW